MNRYAAAAVISICCERQEPPAVRNYGRVEVDLYEQIDVHLTTAGQCQLCSICSPQTLNL